MIEQLSVWSTSQPVIIKIYINSNPKLAQTYFSKTFQTYLPSGGDGESIQFNSIQFICIAQFHKLQICLGVLYNLYT